MNRFTELLDLIESSPGMKELGLTNTRKETVLEALRIASATHLPRIEHATDNEKRIVGKLVEDLLAAGFQLSVNDVPLKRSTDAGAIYAALSSAGEDYLLVHELGKTDRWVRLIWGNDVDVISDYHTSLEPHMAGANTLANELDE